MDRPDDLIGAPASVVQMGPVPAALLDTPLDYIFADHFRQRCLCGFLRQVAVERRVKRNDAEIAVAMLTHDMTLHHADEEEDLFPAVRRRAVPEDALEPLLARLAGDHDDAQPLIKSIVSALDRQKSKPVMAVSKATARAMDAYAKSEQRHLSIENSIVLVLARKRLTPGDLVAMSASMKARRGIPT